MRPIVTVVAWSVCPCLSHERASHTKTDEGIQMSSGGPNSCWLKERCIKLEAWHPDGNRRHTIIIIIIIIILLLCT